VGLGTIREYYRDSTPGNESLVWSHKESSLTVYVDPAKRADGAKLVLPDLEGISILLFKGIHFCYILLDNTGYIDMMIFRTTLVRSAKKSELIGFGRSLATSLDKRMHCCT
jgi:hypothetical protein